MCLSRADGLAGGDALDFDEGVFGEGFDGHGAAGGEGFGKVLGVDFVHRGEVAHVGEEDGGLHDVGEAEAGGFEDGGGIFDGLFRLLLDAAFGEGAGGGIDGELTRDEDETVAAVDGRL